MHVNEMTQSYERPLPDIVTDPEPDIPRLRASADQADMDGGSR
jgi:hypothetical protein